MKKKIKWKKDKVYGTTNSHENILKIDLLKDKRSSKETFTKKFDPYKLFFDAFKKQGGE